ncbi:MAG: septal ring lytic transglycosylase RlpA family protein [Holophagales bacterium]|nr:septal ring lytic transglycosylase RlpA family protein [Holophagales bacterium]MYG30409.1 septal ring lytic transglycosylase RlpA family protein [Holophagales bacterium]MYI81455.1 septal ring lytic transglycosylase RlpA family protein [Holophagales bacterium]
MRQPRSRPDRTRSPLTASLATVLATGLLAGCVSTRGLESPNRGTTQRGLASWYGAKFHGRPTASGEIYDMNRISAAHKQLPLGTVVLVKNRDNGKKLRVPINDRGPFIKGRIIDLSVGAARQLEMFGQGLANVRIKVVRLPPKKRQLPISYPARGWRDSKPNRDRGSGFTIQAGAFRKRSSAVALARRLRRELHLDNVKVTRGRGVHRVQIERRRKQAADDVLQRLKDAGIAAFLVG